MEFIELIKHYPLESSTLITIAAGAAGWTIRNIVQLILDNSRYWREQRTFFWKEKIDASKKASEFYFEYLNLLNMFILQFKLYNEGKLEHSELITSVENEVNFYSQRLKQFPHFEHHHINLFYDFNEKENLEIANKNYELLQKVTEISKSKDFNEEKIKKHFEEINNNYKTLFDNHLKYIELVRNDIKKYI